jgi:hypothetical protein
MNQTLNVLRNFIATTTFSFLRSCSYRLARGLLCLPTRCKTRLVREWLEGPIG